MVLVRDGTLVAIEAADVLAKIKGTVPVFVVEAPVEVGDVAAWDWFEEEGAAEGEGGDDEGLPGSGDALGEEESFGV